MRVDLSDTVNTMPMATTSTAKQLLRGGPGAWEPLGKAKRNHKKDRATSDQDKAVRSRVWGRTFEPCDTAESDDSTIHHRES